MTIANAPKRIKQLTGQEVYTDTADNYWFFYCTFVIFYKCVNEEVKLIRLHKPSSKKKPKAFSNFDLVIDHTDNILKPSIL